MSNPPTLDWERLILIAGGHTAFQLLWAGVELRLYDKLSARPGQSLDELAQSLGIAHQPARILLIGLTDELKYSGSSKTRNGPIAKPSDRGAIGSQLVEYQTDVARMESIDIIRLLTLPDDPISGGMICGAPVTFGLFGLTPFRWF